LALAAGKAMLGGSDAHTERGIGHTWTEVPGATTVPQFFAGLRAGKGVVGGRHGNQGTMSSDITRFAASLLAEQASEAARAPLSWRTPGVICGGLLGLPLLTVALAAGLLHFVHEQRFNRDLLFDLVARPSELLRRVPGLAA